MLGCLRTSFRTGPRYWGLRTVATNVVVGKLIDAFRPVKYPQHNTYAVNAVIAESAEYTPVPVGLKIEIHEIHQYLRNAMCIINKNPPSATKSTCMKRKLSKSNVSRHENVKLPRNPVLLTKSTHSHAFSREHSTRILRRL